MVEGLSNEEKGILDMDNGMVILVGAELEEGIKRANGNEKTIKILHTHTQKDGATWMRKCSYCVLSDV